MNLHKPSGSVAFGLLLALVAAWIWGTLPVALKILVQTVDVVTLTWFRFVGAGLLLLPLALRRGGLVAAVRLRGAPLALLAMGVAGLVLNHLAFQKGLEFISPGTAQIVIQLSPVFMLVVGMLLFGERFRRLQWVGVVALLGGMALFFHQRLAALRADVDQQGTGVLLIVAAALTWGFYLVGQKQLLVFLRPEAVLVCIYLSGALLLAPAVDTAAIAALSPPRFALCLSTIVMAIVSYLGFAGALSRVEASRVGMVIALTPLAVFVNMHLVSRMAPGLLEPENLTWVGLWGGGIVVVGSMLSALGGGTGERPPAA